MKRVGVITYRGGNGEGVVLKPCLLLIGLGAMSSGQTGLPLTGLGYMRPPSTAVAPGQLATLFVYDVIYGDTAYTRQGGQAPAGADLPTALAGVSAGFQQLTDKPLVFQAPILDVHPFYLSPAPNPIEAGTAMTAVTIQIPFEAVLSCDVSLTACPAGAGLGSATLFVRDASNGGIRNLSAFQMDVGIQSDQVHIVAGCDSLKLNLTLDDVRTLTAGLPCPSTVTHADGSPVSAKNPAKAGELLVAYAVGLGQTNPPLATGKLVTAAAPTQTTFGLDFNFRPNALATKPLPGAPQPIYAGATPGFVGLYQINFVVPPVPAGTPPCVDASALPLGSNVVYSNLTVSIGGAFSFDAARICVAVPTQ